MIRIPFVKSGFTSKFFIEAIQHINIPKENNLCNPESHYSFTSCVRYIYVLTQYKSFLPIYSHHQRVSLGPGYPGRRAAVSGWTPGLTPTFPSVKMGGILLGLLTSLEIWLQRILPV